MAVTNECENCVHEGPKCYIRGDWEEMRSYCFLHRIYEPCRRCRDYEEYETDNTLRNEHD